MLTLERLRRRGRPQSSGANIVVAPCVAIHTEESQVERFVDRVHSLSFPINSSNAEPRNGPISGVRVLAVASPLIYVQVASDASVEMNGVLRREAEVLFGSGRIAAHRVYQLDWSCADPQWIMLSNAFKAHGEIVVRVVAYPSQLQTKMTELLVTNGIATHPTDFTHELFVTTQPEISSQFFFGLAKRDLRGNVARAIQLPLDPTTKAEAPCRAFFKMQESLVHHVSLSPGTRVLDVGASPGGWTDCLLRHSAHVVAIDPGVLKIPLHNRPVIHLPYLLEDAFDQLLVMERFGMAVCDINVRVTQMAALMLQVAPLLEPSARVVFTLKLGKKPTREAVERAFDEVQGILSPSFTEFKLVWLHANTQNERTLFATKKP